MKARLGFSSDRCERTSRDVLSLLAHLPQLPTLLRYYDSVQEKHHTLREFSTCQSFYLRVDGRTRRHNFSHLSKDGLLLLRHVVVDLFSRVESKTVSTHLGNLKSTGLTEDFLYAASMLTPDSFRAWWVEHCQPSLTERQCGALKAVLRSMCTLKIGHWSRNYKKYVSKLPTPPKNRYAAIEAGDCFIPVADQAKCTDWLDEFSEMAAVEPHSLSLKMLREACALTLSYQFGIRPVQISSIRIADVIIRDKRVYVRILVAKQRDGSVQHISRRLKPEWVAPWIEFARRRPSVGVAPHAHEKSFLGLPPERISSEISSLVERITGSRWTPNDFRHSGAQRLADAGASHEEIQEYLMHATDGAANAYFTGSGAQAEKVNQAMGLSDIYSGVAEIARTGMIERTVLEALPEDRQIGGIPHGFPVAGLGACKVGQSHCTKNPVLSCYGCRHFLPLNEPAIHDEVADGLRGVVRDFFDAASDVDASPAYGQLRRTIEAADRAAAQSRYQVGEPE